MNSIKTSLFGILAAIGAAFLGCVEWGLIDLADWPKQAKGIAWLLVAMGGGGIGVFARDNSKRSEDAIKPKRPNDKAQIRLPISVLLCVAGTIVLFGCSTSRVVVKRSDGSEMRGFNSRWFWNTEGFALHSTATNAFSLEIQKSNPDAESLKAVAEGAAKGAVKGAVPTP
jgi:hypothetical protein